MILVLYIFGYTWLEPHWLLVDLSCGMGYSYLTRVDYDHLGIVYDNGLTHLRFSTHCY